MDGHFPLIGRMRPASKHWSILSLSRLTWLLELSGQTIARTRSSTDRIEAPLTPVVGDAAPQAVS